MSLNPYASPSLAGRRLSLLGRCDLPGRTCFSNAHEGVGDYAVCRFFCRLEAAFIGRGVCDWLESQPAQHRSYEKPAKSKQKQKPKLQLLSQRLLMYFLSRRMAHHLSPFQSRCRTGLHLKSGTQYVFFTDSNCALMAC